MALKIRSLIAEYDLRAVLYCLLITLEGLVCLLVLLANTSTPMGRADLTRFYACA